MLVSLRANTLVVLANGLSLSLSQSSASAATFFPEKGTALTRPKLRTEKFKTRFIGGLPYVQVDDMLFPEQQLLLSGFSARRWPSGKLIFSSSGLTPAQMKAFRAGCNLWERYSKVRCTPRTTQAGGYMRVVAVGGNVSSTVVGYPGPSGISRMELCCFNAPDHIAHELGHAWGLAHEQSRPDRDTLVAINWQNIKAGAAHNFDKAQADVYGSYDFRSRMHYSQFAFSKNGLRTIVVKAPNQAYQTVIGTVHQLSASDLAGMRARYP